MASFIERRAAKTSVETGFSIDTDAGEIALDIASITPRVHDALVAEERILEDRVLARARQLAATLRKVRTGSYVASIQGQLDDDVSGVIARVYSGLPAANILEYGGVIPAHDIVPVDTKALHFAAFLRGDVFAARVHSPGATIKGKPVLHRALAEMQTQIIDGLVDAGVGTVDRMEF